MKSRKIERWDTELQIEKGTVHLITEEFIPDLKALRKLILKRTTWLDLSYDNNDASFILFYSGVNPFIKAPTHIFGASTITHCRAEGVFCREKIRRAVTELLAYETLSKEESV